VNWQVVVDVAAWFYLVYFAAFGACNLLLNACSLFELPRQLEAGLPGLLPRPHERYEPPVSVIMPAFNEEATIAAAVGSILQLEYPELEVIVVNDGSRDGTLEALTREYSLVPFPEAYRRQIECEPVHAVYRSTTHPNLRVIDKDNGGKSDASNAGINAARYPLVCIVDADSILERGSLRQVVLPLLTEPHTIAAGGCVRIVNGCEVRGGLLEKIGLPRQFLPLAQVVEYLRGFLFGRLGWAPMNAGYIIRDGVYAQLDETKSRMINFRDPDTGWSQHMQVVAVDTKGRTMEAEGFAVSRMSESGYGTNSLMRWEFDGKIGWGEDQDVWMGPHFLRMLDALRASR